MAYREWNHEQILLEQYNSEAEKDIIKNSIKKN